MTPAERSSSTGTSVICLGVAVLDHVMDIAEIPRAPVKVLASARVARCGGPAATAAVACRALGAAADLWSYLGDDPEGAFVDAQLRRHGVGLGATLRRPGAISPMAVVLVDGAGERLIFGHLGDALPRDIGHLPLHEVGRAGAVLADIAWTDGAIALLEAASAAGVPSVLDAEESRDDALEGLATRASLPVFSEGAFARLSGGAAPDAASCAALAARVGPELGVTIGDRGSAWWLDGGFVHVPALPVEARDTTGAGDVFHGALAVALAECRPMPEAIRFATAAAGLKCAMGRGWDGMPTRAEVEAAMRRLAYDWG